MKMFTKFLYSLPFAIQNNGFNNKYLVRTYSTSLPTSFLFKGDFIYLQNLIDEILEPYYKQKNTITHVRFYLNYKSDIIELRNDMVINNDNMDVYSKQLDIIAEKMY
jgi:hypothetical protein